MYYTITIYDAMLWKHHIMNGKYLIGGKSTLKVMVTKDATKHVEIT